MAAGRWWTTEGPLAEWGHLSVRPAPPTEQGPTGLQPLGLGQERDGLLYVPDGYRPERPARLVLTLHGGSGRVERGLATLHELADEFNLILLAPASRERTWDLVLGGYGPDIEFLSRAIEHVLGRYTVDLNGIVLSGVSDGATYALSLGLTNGDLFSHLVGFSPGFILPGAPRGKPRVFISHGTKDTMLPIETCGWPVVAAVRGGGYDLNFREFDGGHVVPPEVAREAVEWFTAG